MAGGGQEDSAQWRQNTHLKCCTCLSLAGVLPQKTLRKDAEDYSSVAQQFGKATEARTNLAGCGFNAVEGGFKLFISSLCAGLLPYFHLINGALIKK